MMPLEPMPANPMLPGQFFSQSGSILTTFTTAPFLSEGINSPVGDGSSEGMRSKIIRRLHLADAAQFPAELTA
jgi:hypothetical protein